MYAIYSIYYSIQYWRGSRMQFSLAQRIAWRKSAAAAAADWRGALALFVVGIRRRRLLLPDGGAREAQVFNVYVWICHAQRTQKTNPPPPRKPPASCPPKTRRWWWWWRVGMFEYKGDIKFHLIWITSSGCSLWCSTIYSLHLLDALHHKRVFFFYPSYVLYSLQTSRSELSFMLICTKYSKTCPRGKHIGDRKITITIIPLHKECIHVRFCLGFELSHLAIWAALQYKFTLNPFEHIPFGMIRNAEWETV